LLSLLFPGQGSQAVGMGRDAFDASPAARAVFETADDALGFPLSKLCFEGPEDELVRTEHQQPAILTTSIALLRALEAEVELAPAYVGGHSLGEYSALVASGALRFEDAVRTVASRGRFMQEAVPQGEGAMAAVMGASPEAVDAACTAAASELGRVVTPANYNSGAQTVIAGHADAVALACTKATEAGAKRTVDLPVSAPFHCALMAPAAERLAPLLDALDVARPTVPVVTNVEAEPNDDPTRIASLLREQVTAPVRFTEMIERLNALGTTRYLEIGPGRVLSGLVARIERRSKRANFGGMEDLEGVEGFLADAG
jgi:[acyl-carrier-protein] S-malonyltransferase